MKKGVPIKPSDIPAQKALVIPSFVFDCFNASIALNFQNGRANVIEHVVWKLIKEKCKENGIEPDLHFLNIEEAYRANGWKVEYDKPAYCETYDASYTFTEIK
jgi:hypothetical protein